MAGYYGIAGVPNVIGVRFVEIEGSHAAVGNTRFVDVVVVVSLQGNVGEVVGMMTDAAAVDAALENYVDLAGEARAAAGVNRLAAGGWAGT